MVKIQIASDLHIERYDRNKRLPTDLIVPSAPVLALIGDIGNACTDQLRDFLYFQAGRFEIVLFVVGNHEFYNSSNSIHTVDQQFEWIRNVCRGRPNLHLLEKRAIEIQGIQILGTALWSYIPEEKHCVAERKLNDYKLIYMKDAEPINIRRLRAADTQHWHKESVAWLEKKLAECQQKQQPAVVLTHHTPLLPLTSHPKYQNAPEQCCFSSDLSHLLRTPVRVWCCGHTHYNFDITIAGRETSTRLVSNQRGYEADSADGYNPSFLVEIDQ